MQEKFIFYNLYKKNKVFFESIDPNSLTDEEKTKIKKYIEAVKNIERIFDEVIYPILERKKNGKR